ncbi:hypothetical protein P153DRAFT_371533 [Dothidotthia symphoricarpi CBS 119687]|uniref:Uncharacterized protein n=1 Tax=Dothidotthia symphoricarpi CBS 119687 TaxID=1392245 RepID=A0A6A5ZYY2_9PLEO|nr:uncharacterized protein P153DRAFT_371533 [Dothidotthia symphoricarpi CBS 119687]KAF2123618.1 hypothetical protein P153DRAFT_371533 [Dothidotthia symphoricarpi CBS 119687]
MPPAESLRRTERCTAIVKTTGIQCRKRGEFIQYTTPGGTRIERCVFHGVAKTGDTYAPLLLESGRREMGHVTKTIAVTVENPRISNPIESRPIARSLTARSDTSLPRFARSDITTFETQHLTQLDIKGEEAILGKRLTNARRRQAEGCIDVKQALYDAASGGSVNQQITALLHTSMSGVERLNMLDASTNKLADHVYKQTQILTNHDQQILAHTDALIRHDERNKKVQHTLADVERRLARLEVRSNAESTRPVRSAPTHALPSFGSSFGMKKGKHDTLVEVDDSDTDEDDMHE